MTSLAVSTDRRFKFGKNWRQFLESLNDERVRTAEDSLRAMLGVQTLDGLSFLDIGSGSGLFSLAAMRLNASRVHSFDYDVDSVECTFALKRRFSPDSDRWTVERGSVLDESYLASLGSWDVVYSWGVLHHTGDMQRAFANVRSVVAEGGRLYIAIYNDQGWKSKAWTAVKRVYVSGPLGRFLVLCAFVPYFVGGAFVVDVARGRNPRNRYAAGVRGMSHWRDWIDWLGGYPFEVASRAAVMSYFEANGFSLERLNGCGTKHGCNEFLFRRCISSS